MIVSGHAQMLRRRLDRRPSSVRAIDAIQTAPSRGESLTRQLLAFSRRQPLSPVVRRSRQRIERCARCSAARCAATSSSHATSRPDSGRPVDLGELELALVNIAVNARDAMPDGGKIMLSARNVTLRAGRMSDDLDGDFVALTMTDTGTGIPPDVLPKVFEPFFTTKAVGKGTGLGLSQVYGFAHQSGGAVTIDSELGRGTTITHLPAAQPRAGSRCREAAAQPSAAPAKAPCSWSRTIREVADVTSTLLAQLGYRVVRADNAAEALARLRQDDESTLCSPTSSCPAE